MDLKDKERGFERDKTEKDIGDYFSSIKVIKNIFLECFECDIHFFPFLNGIDVKSHMSIHMNLHNLLQLHG